MKLTAQNGSLCSPIQKTGWLSVLWNPTGNQKLKELEKAKQDYAIYNSKKAWIPSEKEEQDILDLAQKISEIWNRTNIYAKRKEADYPHPDR